MATTRTPTERTIVTAQLGMYVSAYVRWLEEGCKDTIPTVMPTLSRYPDLIEMGMKLAQEICTSVEPS
jgi:hypothetical protein